MNTVIYQSLQVTTEKARQQGLEEVRGLIYERVDKKRGEIYNGALEDILEGISSLKVE